MKFYLRMGFLPLELIEEASHDEVALISKPIFERIAKLDPKALSEFKKYTPERRNDWEHTTKNRESLLNAEELEQRKRISSEAVRRINNLP